MSATIYRSAVDGWLVAVLGAGGLIRSGPVTRRVPITDITGIVPTRNPLSSPALSLDRLRIEVRGARPVLISPADRDGFLADLEARRAAGTTG